MSHRTFEILEWQVNMADAKNSKADYERALSTGLDLDGKPIDKADRAWLARAISQANARITHLRAYRP